MLCSIALLSRVLWYTQCNEQSIWLEHWFAKKKEKKKEIKKKKKVKPTLKKIKILQLSHVPSLSIVMVIIIFIPSNFLSLFLSCFLTFFEIEESVEYSTIANCPMPCIKGHPSSLFFIIHICYSSNITKSQKE